MKIGILFGPVDFLVSSKSIIFSISMSVTGSQKNELGQITFLK